MLCTKVTTKGPHAANPDIGLTAFLTPHGWPVPLAVESLTTTELVVRAPASAPSDLEFDYIVCGDGQPAQLRSGASSTEPLPPVNS